MAAKATPPALLVLEDGTALHASKSRNSPFAAMALPGRVVATFLRGTATVIDGKVTR